MGARRHLTHAARMTGAVVGTSLVFVVSAVGGTILHLGTPCARRVVAREVNAGLAPLFKGRIRVERIDALGLLGHAGADATVDDASGRPVIVAHGVRATVSTWTLVRSLLAKGAPIHVVLPAVGVDALDVRLDAAEDGVLELVRAFGPARPSAPSTSPGPGVLLELPRVTVRHARAHGAIPGAPPLDAEVDDLDGAFTASSARLEIDVARATLLAHGLAGGADVRGALKAHAVVPLDGKSELGARVEWEGAAGAVAQSVRGSLEGQRVDVVADVPACPPDALRTLWPGSPLSGETAAHLEAHGTLPDLDVTAHARAGRATADVKGRVAVGDAKHAELTLAAHEVDVRELEPSAPESRLGLSGTVEATLDPVGLAGEAALRFEGGVLGGHDVPPATIHATGSRSAAGKALRGDLELTVDEPGAPTHLTARLDPSRVVTFALDSTIPDLARVPELRRATGGRLQLSAKGVLDVAKMTISAALHAEASGLAPGAASVDSASVDVEASGPIVAPELAVRLDARGITAGPFHVASASASADGSPTASHVALLARGPDLPDVDASFDLRLVGGVTLDHVRVALASRGEGATVTADTVRVAGGTTSLDGGRVEGLGAVTTADATLAGGALRLRAKTDGVDLSRVARLAHLGQAVQGGTLAFDVDVTASRKETSGRATVALDHATLEGVKDLSARVVASIDGRKVSGKAHAEAAGVGTLEITAPALEIGGEGALSAGSWRRAWGNVDFEARADLAKIAALVPADRLPVAEARGQVLVTGHAERDGLSDTTPDLALHVNTTGLALAAKAARVEALSGEAVVRPAPWALSGIDLQLDATLDGSSGALSVGATARDDRGELADLQVTSPQALCQELFTDTARCVDALRETRFEARVSVPERDLASLPAALRQSVATGRFQATASASGTLLAPTIDVSASLSDGRSRWERRPMGLEIGAHYDGARATATVGATYRDRKILDASASVDAPVGALLDGAAGLPWVGSARAHFDGFPIQAIPALDDKLVTGLLSGDVSVDDLHKDARAQADLSVASLVVGTVACKGVSLRASAGAGKIDAAARFDQTDGFAEAKASGSATWGAALAPALDPEQPLRASLVSRNLRLVALQPLVTGVLDEIDGRLTADLRAELDPKSRGAKLSGGLTLSGGTVEAVAGGGELHDIAASVKLTPDGTITLEKLTGSGITGRFTASGLAHVNGTRLESAKATLDVPGGAAIPLIADGSEIGALSGHVEATAAEDAAGALAVTVNVPSMRVALPEGTTTHAQALGPIDKVVIGAHRAGPGRFVTVPIDPVVEQETGAAAQAGGGGVTIAVGLGSVEVVRGTDLKVDLGGKLGVQASGAPRVTGQIQLKSGGSLDVQGKKFTVESGTVTFVGDNPSNPEVVVKASWTAPDGTVVYANFLGPLKTGKVTLQSQPALSRQEIVQLLLFGSADGQQAQTPTAGTENNAIATAGGEAAAPLNHALGQLGLSAVSTRIDTSQTNPRPEVEVQIARDLSVQVAVVLGVPPPGVNPDRTLLTLDWRFLSKWSLASTVGDAGTTVFDVLWKKRY